jgi:hypothetical protein
MNLELNDGVRALQDSNVERVKAGTAGAGVDLRLDSGDFQVG